MLEINYNWAINKINTFVELQDNWDAENGKPIFKSSMDNAKKMIRVFQSKKVYLPRLEIIPMNEGYVNVQLENYLNNTFTVIIREEDFKVFMFFGETILEEIIIKGKNGYRKIYDLYLRFLNRKI